MSVSASNFYDTLSVLQRDFVFSVEILPVKLLANGLFKERQPVVNFPDEGNRPVWLPPQALMLNSTTFVMPNGSLFVVRVRHGRRGHGQDMWSGGNVQWWDERLALLLPLLHLFGQLRVW